MRKYMSEFVQNKFSAIVLLFVLFVSPIHAQFTKDNLVVSHLTLGSMASSVSAVSLVEYTPSGVTTGFSVAMPTVASQQNPPPGTSLAMTENTGGIASGFFTLQSNGQALAVGGYNQTLGGSVSPGPPLLNRTLGLVAPSGTVNSTNGFNDSDPATDGSLRGITSTDGSGFWFTTVNSLRYSAATGDVHPSVPLASSATFRMVSIQNGNLFIARIGSVKGVALVTGPGGSSLPKTATGLNTTILPGTDISTTAVDVSPISVVMLNNPLNTNTYLNTGLNTLYVSDDRATADGGGLLRYVFNGADWGTATTVNPGAPMRGLTGRFDPVTHVTSLYGLTSETNANSLVSITDTLTATGGNFGSFSILATTDSAHQFRGIAFTPTPEPGLLAIMSFGVCGILRFRKK